jgi:molybdate transport system substrate-binding protein
MAMIRGMTIRVFFAVAACVSFSAHAADVTVSAAASLTNAFRELAPLFESANPGTRVLCNFGASGALLQQISRGAPADVFASADQETMDQAHAQKLIVPATRRDFVSNALVVVVPNGATLIPKDVAELAQPAYARIAIGLPASVPVGRYTKGVLEAARLWSAVEPRMVGADSVRQALDYVARGEVDAGFVYATDAAIMPDKVKVALSVPTTKPILYPVAAVAGSPNGLAAARFVEFLATAPAQAVLAKFGFRKP